MSLFAIRGLMVVVNEQECTGCQICVEACPAGAIAIVDEIAHIDHSECTECLTCVDECPVEAISEEP